MKKNGSEPPVHGKPLDTVNLTTMVVLPCCLCTITVVMHSVTHFQIAVNLNIPQHIPNSSCLASIQLAGLQAAHTQQQQRCFQPMQVPRRQTTLLAHRTAS